MTDQLFSTYYILSAPETGLPSGVWRYVEADKTLHFLYSDESANFYKAGPWTPHYDHQSQWTYSSMHSHGLQAAIDPNAMKKPYHERSYIRHGYGPKSWERGSNSLESPGMVSSSHQYANHVDPAERCGHSLDQEPQAINRRLPYEPYMLQSANRFAGLKLDEDSEQRVQTPNSSEKPQSAPAALRVASIEHSLASLNLSLEQQEHSRDAEDDNEEAWTERRKQANEAAIVALCKIETFNSRDVSDEVSKIWEVFREAESPSMEAWESAVLYKWVARCAREIFRELGERSDNATCEVEARVD